MGGGIFVRKDGTWVEMPRQPFSTEDELQALLAAHPHLIAGHQIDEEEPRRWVLVRREISIPSEQNGTGRWSLDHLLLDQAGIPTLVEVKKAENNEARRMVVAQILDYAANAVLYWPVEQLRQHFEAQCQAAGLDAESVLAEHLGPEADVDDFWTQVKTNLQAGRIRLLVVTDQVPGELRRIIEFLNAQMDPAEILAVELRQFTDGERCALVPQVFGHVSAAERRKNSLQRQGRIWDEAAFFADVSQPGVVQHLKHAFQWATETFDVTWGRGHTRGSFRISPKGAGRNIAFFESNGTVYINMPNLIRLGMLPEADRTALVQRLNRVPGVAIPLQSAKRHWVSFRVQQVGQANLSQLFSVLAHEFGVQPAPGESRA